MKWKRCISSILILVLLISSVTVNAATDFNTDPFSALPVTFKCDGDSYSISSGDDMQRPFKVHSGVGDITYYDGLLTHTKETNIYGTFKDNLLRTIKFSFARVSETTDYLCDDGQNVIPKNGYSIYSWDTWTITDDMAKVFSNTMPSQLEFLKCIREFITGDGNDASNCENIKFVTMKYQGNSFKGLGDSVTIKESLKDLDWAWLYYSVMRPKWDSHKTIYDTPTVDMLYCCKKWTTAEGQGNDDWDSLNTFCQKMYNDSDNLTTLLWWFNNYYKKSNEPKIKKDMDNFKLSDYSTGHKKVALFLFYCATGRALDPNEQRQLNQQQLAQNIQNDGGATDTSSFGDWCKAFSRIANGMTLADNAYTEDFLDPASYVTQFTSEQRVQLFSILAQPNIKIDDSVANHAEFKRFYQNIDTKLATQASRVNAANDVMNAAAILQEADANLNAFTLDAWNNGWTSRMLSFKDRVNFLVAFMNTKTDADMPDYVERFYGDVIPGDLFFVAPNGGAVVFSQSSTLYKGTLPGIKSAKAYKYLTYTMNEVYSLSATLPADASQWVADNTLATKTDYIKGLADMHDALVSIGSAEIMKLWNEPFDRTVTTTGSAVTASGSAVMFNTLDDVYNYLMQNDMFNSIDTAVSALDCATPLNQFMDLGEKKLSPLLLKGIAYSAKAMPMYTNVYDPYTLANYDDKFLKEFHYKYGFHRKALYIDNNATAAVDLHNTGRKGQLKVCTLRTFLNRAGDVVLYLDDNFYNVNVLAEIQNEAFERLDNVDEKTDERPWYKKLWDKVTDNFVVNIVEQTKTAEETRYSDTLRRRISSTSNSGYMPAAVTNDANASGSAITDNEDQYVMTSGQINDYLDGVTETKKVNEEDGTVEATKTYDSYSVLMSYAVVSAIYRDEQMFKFANENSIGKPVFIASKDLPCIKSTTQYEKNCILNYALLRNLKDNIPVGYNYNLDMDSPLYMDIYGNILTESGVIVVPSACNATLYGDGYYKDLYNVGLFATYADNWAIPTDYSNLDKTLKEAFVKDEDLEVWKVRSRVIKGEIADYARVATGDLDASDAIQKQFEYNLDDSVKLYDFDKYAHICLEVLRGAPIENIDKGFEGLLGDTRLSLAGLTASAKLQVIQEALRSSDINSIFALPNLAFVDGFEYVALFTFKIMMAVILVILMVMVYLDVVGARLSWQTALRALYTVTLTVVTVVAVPEVFDLTYYMSNRGLLQDEALYISMLNQEKQESGVEIGVTEIGTPDISTKLMLKLEPIEVPWYDLFSKIMLDSTFDSLEQIYAEYAEETGISNRPDVEVMNDGAYVYVDDVYNASDVNVTTSNSELHMNTKEDATFAFYTPYYAILEVLLQRVNDYNNEYNWHAYTTKTQNGGRLKTLGLISAYLKSKDFMDSDGDILEINTMHLVDKSLESNDVFSKEEITQMQRSLWTQADLTDEEIDKRSCVISDYAREFVSENRELIGKITDETFLESMALALAIKHNQVFGIDSCSALEIYKLSNDDLMRLSMDTKEVALANSTLSYSRFVYESGGTVAVYAAVFLSAVLWLAGYIKPLATIVIFILIFASLFVFRILLRKKESTLQGYILTVLLLCTTNVAYACMLKLSLYLPGLGVSPTVCIILQIVMQLSFVLILLALIRFTLKEWRDLGAERYQAKLQKMKHTLLPSFLRGRGDHQYDVSPMHKRNKNKDAWDIYDNMVSKHKTRANIRNYRREVDEEKETRNDQHAPRH